MVDFYGRAGKAAMVALLAFSAPAFAAEIEVFHYLDTRADAQRVAVLRDAMKASGSTWKDFTVANGWTGRSESLLRLRAQSQNPPAAAMMKAPFMHQWAAGGALLALDDVAAAQRWDELLPKPVADSVKYKGRYYAIPLNIHRVNWLWINEAILKESGTPAPTTWDEFFVTAEAMKRNGSPWRLPARRAPASAGGRSGARRGSRSDAPGTDARPGPDCRCRPAPVRSGS